MALSEEEEVQRLILLGAMSQLPEEERAEILAMKDSILEVFRAASQPELAFAALGLASAEWQRED